MEVFALGEMGLGFDYFYSLTPRVFNNVASGYMAKTTRNDELFLKGIRKLGFWILSPYVKKEVGFKEADLFRLPSESEDPDSSQEDLEKVIEQVAQDKEFWDKLDQTKNGSSTS